MCTSKASLPCPHLLQTLPQGYSSGDPQKRVNPLHLAGMLATMGLVGTTIKVAVDLLRQR